MSQPDRPIQFGTDGFRTESAEQLDFPRISESLCLYAISQGKLLGFSTDTNGRNFDFGDRFMGGNIFNFPSPFLGVLPTGMAAYMSARFKWIIGACTASHNPHKFSGIKILEDGYRIDRTVEEAIERYSVEGPNEEERAHMTGIIGDHNRNLYTMAGMKAQKKLDDEFYKPMQEHPAHYHSEEQYVAGLYTADILKGLEIDNLEGLKIAVDCANGAGRAAIGIYEKTGARVEAHNVITPNDILFDGAHINENCGTEHARKTPGYLASLSKDKKLTFAFDGDADRLMVWLPEFETIDALSTEHVLYCFARYLQSQGKGSKVVTTETINQGLIDSLTDQGIEVIIVEKGDRHLEGEIRNNPEIMCGAEPSGNFMANAFPHPAADAIAASLLFSKIYHKEHENLMRWAAEIKLWDQLSGSIHAGTVFSDAGLNSLKSQIRGQFGLEESDFKIRVWNSTTEHGVIKYDIQSREPLDKTEKAKITEMIKKTI